jgi:CHAT domain-containing protein
LTQSHLQAAATEEAIKSLRNLYLLHIATHGFFLNDEQIEEGGLDQKVTENLKFNPLLRSGLLLAGCKQNLSALEEADRAEDGILTAYEAANLNLGNTDLVVLSACETGLGEVRNGEGVYGLQRAFLTAGAKTLLMSLWTVSDEATQVLMTNFYRNWVESGNKRQAFKKAQMELREKYPQPYFWGAFVMVGE